MDSSCFALTIEDKVARLTMNRPRAFNAMDRAFWSDLPALVRDIDENARARVIVLASEGKHFSSGMDLSVFADGDNVLAADADVTAKAEAFRQFVLALQDTFSCLEQARMPVIAAVQGGCMGAAVDMIAACDIRYATEDAFFQIQEINIGMTADVGTFPRLCKLIPEGWVRELAYTGRRLDAAKAKEIGLVNAVFPTQEAMLEYVNAVAREIAEKSPVAVSGSKRMINYARDHSTADALDYIATWQAGMFSPAHLMEAFAAKTQKRPAEFPDLMPLRKKL